MPKMDILAKLGDSKNARSYPHLRRPEAGARGFGIAGTARCVCLCQLSRRMSPLVAGRVTLVTLVRPEPPHRRWI
jgi:hypothetical protein